jgi:hypothetical protein
MTPKKRRIDYKEESYAIIGGFLRSIRTKAVVSMSRSMIM